MKSGSSSNTDVASLIDHTEIKAKLSKALEEKNTFMSKYEVKIIFKYIYLIYKI